MPKGLTQSWIAAMATLPPEWQLMGVVRYSLAPPLTLALGRCNDG
jgi:hypothetical protein